jgi:6-phosphogluconolactonase
MNKRRHSLFPMVGFLGTIMFRSIGSVTFLALLMVGCGGGGSSPTPPAATFTVGGTVTGLSGTGLVLNSNFGGDLPISASGPYAFSTRLLVGSTYQVGIESQPTAQGCQIVNGTGTIAASNVITVSVTCESGIAIGGTVSGLVGSGLTLQICPLIALDHGGGFGGGPPVVPPCRSGLQIGVNGVFALGFDPTGFMGKGFSGNVLVAIDQQPSSPWQQCRVGNAKISIASPSDTSVTVSCTSFSYVTNAADNTLLTYSIDPSTGALSVIGTPIGAGASPNATASLDFDPIYDINRYLFVSNEGSNDLSAFVVDNTSGALNAVPGSPFPAGKDPTGMAIMGYADGYNLYVANAGSDTVSAYSIDLNTGALAGFSTVATGKGPASIVIDDNRGYAFVANNGGSNDISAFYVGVRTDAPIPVPGSPFPAGGSPRYLALVYGGKFLYSANPDATNPSISGFSINPDTGVLSPLSGSPFPLPVSHGIATDLAGTYLYVTSGASILGYRIDANTGALTALAGFPVSAGANAYSITVDETNQFLYVANEGAASIGGFKLNALTGALTPMSSSPFPAGNDPTSIAAFF